ncbi:MAG: DUF3021 domain-containing protein [Ruminococcaceae bacterium]|nr:DUF3021 domain-containing protein [Oscillospiraceae bacterium]
MEKLKKLRDALIYPACVYFTLILFFFYSFGAAVKGKDVVLTISQIGLLFAFGLSLALCGLLFRVQGMNIIIKVALHFTGTVFAFVVFLVLLSGYFANTSGGLIITLIFCFLYVVVAAVILGIRAAVKRKENDDSRYQSQFDKLKNKE